MARRIAGRGNEGQSIKASFDLSEKEQECRKSERVVPASFWEALKLAEHDVQRFTA